MEQTQTELWHDSWEEALKDVVHVLGGPKKVGATLWPSKNPQDAGRYLNHCLDPERNEKLSLHEIEWLMREGSKASMHTSMTYLSRRCQYEDPKPVTKEHQITSIRKEVLSMGKGLRLALDRLEKLEDEDR